VSARLFHRIIGVLMLLPLLGWAATGAIFFVKPGYGGAYEQLAVKTYPLNGGEMIKSQAGWREVRLVRTILGTHLLARTDAGWRNLDPSSFQPSPIPGEEGLLRLLGDAFTANPNRYGRIVRLVDRTATTDTGVEVVLDWDRLSLQQKGKDTARIDALYRIHYLQWTGHKTADKFVGGIGLLLLVALTLLGARLALGRLGGFLK
jgi:hypothetical protein